MHNRPFEDALEMLPLGSWGVRAAFNLDVSGGASEALVKADITVPLN